MTRKEFLGAYNLGYRDGKIEDYCPNDYDDIFDIEQEPKTERIEYGTDGNSYKLTISNGKELKQEPCDDCCNGNQIEKAKLCQKSYIAGMEHKQDPKWIPVSERLPKKFEFVNCTCHSLIDDREDWVVETVYLPQPSDSPYSDWGNIPMLNRGDCEVVAWIHRDIPEPYKVESEL